MTISVDANKCSGCGACVGECPNAAITIEEIAVIDAVRCTECGVCIDACPVGALSMRVSKNRLGRKEALVGGGQGRSGRGSGGGDGMGQGRGQGRGRGRCGGMGGANTVDAGQCACPACGATMQHRRGTPCTQLRCPKCGAAMVRQ